MVAPCIMQLAPLQAQSECNDLTVLRGYSTQANYLDLSDSSEN